MTPYPFVLCGWCKEREADPKRRDSFGYPMCPTCADRRSDAHDALMMSVAPEVYGND